MPSTDSDAVVRVLSLNQIVDCADLLLVVAVMEMMNIIFKSRTRRCKVIFLEVGYC